jgi:parallel beta-helix repeat protein
MFITDSGGLGNPIVIGDYGSGALPVIDGTGVTMSSYQGMIDIRGLVGAHISNIHVENIYIQYVGQDTAHEYNAIYGRYVDNIRITGCTINDVVDSGIMLRNCDNFEIDNNLVQNCAHCTANMDESISIDGCTDGLIYGNEVHSADIVAYEQCSIGICAKSDYPCARIYIYDNIVHHMCGNGIYACGWDETIEDIYIYNNKVYDCEDLGITVGTEGVADVKRVYVYNNLIYRIGKYGYQSSSLGGDLEDIYVFNNTIAKSLKTYYSAMIVTTASILGTYLIKNNCLFWHDPNLGADTMLGQLRVLTAALAKMTISNNIVYGENDYQVDGDGMPEADDAGEEVWDDPEFTDWGNDDYTVGATSPCRNAGTLVGLPIVPTTDYVGNTRICGGTIDVGCHEYQE